MKRVLCLLLTCLLSIPALAETLPDQGLAFFRNAGIAADSVVLMDRELLVTLTDGGTATIWVFGDFDPYDLTWRFSGATDEDVGRYLNYAFSLLTKIEQRIPADTENLSDEEARRAWNDEVTVSNALLSLENVGEQGLRVLMAQLSAHDDSGLNSLRARLASRLLGSLDASTVDSAEGLAWYDTLEISEQKALPLPDASVYVDGAFLAEVTQRLIAREEALRAGYTWGLDVAPEKTTTIVTLHGVTIRPDEERVHVFARVYSQMYALFESKNGARLRSLSGSIIPSRITVEKADGKLRIAEVIEAGDGTDHWPSILKFCEGSIRLAESLLYSDDTADHEKAVKAYLTSIGDSDAVIE